MNKYYLYASIALVLTITLGFLFKSNIVSKAKNTPDILSDTSLPRGADKIEVLHFHATQQCWSCTTLGSYVKAVIETKFADQYQTGRIVFKDVNLDLVENTNLVKKFQASGSSLFINVIKDNQDHIEEDVKVWRLLNSQSSFFDYFESRLKQLL